MPIRFVERESNLEEIDIDTGRSAGSWEFGFPGPGLRYLNPLSSKAAIWSKPPSWDPEVNLDQVQAPPVKLYPGRVGLGLNKLELEWAGRIAWLSAFLLKLIRPRPLLPLAPLGRHNRHPVLEDICGDVQSCANGTRLNVVSR